MSLALPLLGEAIMDTFGVRAQADPHHPLTGRCLLASYAMAEVLRALGHQCDVIVGTVHVEALASLGLAALDGERHAWCIAGRDRLVDPTAIQLHRPRWPIAICNAGPGLVLEAERRVDLRRTTHTWTQTPMTISYTPWHVARPERRAAIRAPDALPDRWRPVAMKVLQGLRAQTAAA